METTTLFNLISLELKKMIESVNKIIELNKEIDKNYVSREFMKSMIRIEVARAIPKLPQLPQMPLVGPSMFCFFCKQTFTDTNIYIDHLTEEGMCKTQTGEKPL